MSAGKLTFEHIRMINWYQQRPALMTQRRAQCDVRDTPHTYVTHPMRLIVHFWNIKLLSLVRSLHHMGIRVRAGGVFNVTPLFSFFCDSPLARGRLFGLMHNGES